jgi:iron complex outermembrane receptor protein
LYYQTPGGITYEQMLQNATLARQATATLPSAVQQQTAIYNNSFFAALKHNYKLNNKLETQTAIIFSGTDFANPFITNYEKRNEKNTAISSKLFYKKAIGNLQLKWITGFEYLMNHSTIGNYGNKNGQIDTVQYNDIVKVSQRFVFSQLNVNIKKFNLQAGISCNEQYYAYKRLSDASFVNYKNASTKIVATPRLAMSYQLNKNISLYGLVAKGFSPPTLAEIKPSDGNFYSNLKAEYGWNFEAGIKGYLLQNRLQFDIALYHFKLNDAIVRRNNTDGAEYFTNAGNTIQKGIESMFKYQLLKKRGKCLNLLNISNSNSFQPYSFVNYVSGVSNFSGNALTGVPKCINITTVEALFKKQYSLLVMFNYTSSIPLTDTNDTFASDYRLLQIKFSYNFTIKKNPINLFVTADNLLNELYSLGNDINAVGKRFFNPAPARNFLTGISVRLL